VLDINRVSKSFGCIHALREISLTVPAGKTTVLIGPSGCGKSTLLRVMMGLVAADKGLVRFGGQLLTPANALALRREMGYVIQDGGLFPHLTARSNVTLMARFLGWQRPRINDRLVELSRLTKFPLDGLDRYAAQLSGGQKQRVSLMRALMLDPQVLLLDEPLGALDPMIRHELQRDLRGVFSSLGKTVVLVTHDMSEACYFGDLLVLIREGSIVQAGSPRELLGHPAEAFVTDFINAQRSHLWATEVAA